MSRDVHSCTHWLRPRNPPNPLPPAWRLVYEGAILVSKDRRHLFVTPESYPRLAEKDVSVAGRAAALLFSS
jgi:hypothetical protein